MVLLRETSGISDISIAMSKSKRQDEQLSSEGNGWNNSQRFRMVREIKWAPIVERQRIKSAKPVFQDSSQLPYILFTYFFQRLWCCATPFQPPFAPPFPKQSVHLFYSLYNSLILFSSQRSATTLSAGFPKVTKRVSRFIPLPRSLIQFIPCPAF